MNNLSLRNVLILLVAVVLALLALGFVSTLLNQIIPITLALVVGVILGRLSVRMNLVEMVKEALRRPARQAAAPAPAQRESQAAQATPEPLRAEVEAIKRRLEDVQPEPAPQAESEKLDFEIKTEEQVLQEARRREEEIARRNASYDPAAALAERKRRLRGDKADSP
jgi:hypothetical protein